jgi:tetratricopeptide (TPR) repeat protein
MSRPRKQPHLQRKRTPSGALVWVIRDGEDRISTGCGVGVDDAKAQRALADYINGKYQPPTGLGAKLLIDEVVAAYLAGHADSSASRDFLLATATPILEWWSGRRILEVNKTNCKAYVNWRTSQFRKRHPKSKKPPVRVSDQTARHDLKTLRAALRWAEECGELELGLRLGGALRSFWQMGYLSEGRTWLEGLLARAEEPERASITPQVRAKALNCAAWLAHTQTDDAAATRLAEQACALLQDPDDRYDRGFALTTLAMVALNRNDYPRATALQEEALALYREEQDDWAISGCLNNLGLLAGLQGDFARASGLFDEKVARDRRRGDRRATALSLSNLAVFEYAQRRLVKAQTLWTESLTLYGELGGTWQDVVVFEGVEGLAEIAAAQGQVRRAVQVLTAAETLRAAVEVPRPPYIQAAFEDAMATACTALGPRDCATARAEGTSLTMEQVVAAALAAG